jgi:glycosyltransferase involved in cell wall biosynthesis
MNKIVIIIPFRNVANFIQDCANSILAQSYPNWKAIFCDDASTDNSVDYIPKDQRFSIIQNKKRLTALANIHFGITESNLDDEDIVCLLDGDDSLIRRDAFNIINDLYSNSNTLLTYGQYIWPNGQYGHCKAYTKEEFSDLRNGNYWASHMKTFKYKLYKEFMQQDPDLLSFKDSNGEFYTITSDVAIMTPLMEIAGFDRVKFNPDPIYMYRIHQQNDHFVNPNLQKSVEKEIFAKKKFNEIK